MIVVEQHRNRLRLRAESECASLDTRGSERVADRPAGCHRPSRVDGGASEVAALSETEWPVPRLPPYQLPE